MDRLLNPCKAVEIGGALYRVRTDFRIWAQVEEILCQDKGDVVVRLAKLLSLVYLELPPDPMKALDGILWFWSGGASPQNAEGEGGEYRPSYSLNHDFPYIWAAFLGQFGIDLSKTEMHWWQFCTLMECLDGDCCFSRIVTYRRMNLGDIKDRELRSFYMKMKKRYRLPQSSTEECRTMEVTDAFESAIM